VEAIAGDESIRELGDHRRGLRVAGRSARRGLSRAGADRFAVGGHRNMWVRRAAIVGLIPLARRGGALEALYPTARTLHPDQQDLIQKLGAAAPKWAEKILHPPSHLAKLGVKPDWRVAVLGIRDEDFLAELEPAAALVSIGRTVKQCDAIFFGATAASHLDRLKPLKKSLKANGALWVVRPKGRAEITEAAVMAAGKAAGLVDVKVVSFSPTHTAEKFVIPVKDR